MDGLTCLLPSVAVEPGLPRAGVVWLGFSALLVVVLAVPSRTWPDGTAPLLTVLLGAIGLGGGAALWAYVFRELVGSRPRVLSADRIGVRVRADRKTGPLAGRPEVFARWAEVEQVLDAGDHLRLVRARGEDVIIVVPGLRREERAWLTQQLQTLGQGVVPQAEVPEPLVVLRRSLDRDLDRA